MKHYRQHLTRLSLAMSVFLLLSLISLASLQSALAWSEEKIDYFDPLDYRPLSERETYSPNVSTVHFDLVGALAIAAGFSITDAATIQAYSEATDAGPLPEDNPVYTFDADPANYPPAPPISTVITSTICPSPSTTGATVTMGTADFDNMNCEGCFTDRFGPYGVFFHMAHDSADELGAIHDWAWDITDTLIGKVTYGYSSTARFTWRGIANVYDTTPCFVQELHPVDTGSIEAGSMQALGIYLHSLGDNWSHKDCIAAADAQDLPFAAHVTLDDRNDPLWACRWADHEFEFGDPANFPESNRTFSGTLALYEALVDFSQQSNRALYRPIPLHAEDNHIYDTLYSFVHTASVRYPDERRAIADELRTWALDTRENNAAYWRPWAFFPLLLQ
ncbi:MAG: hypothetical protein GXP38_07200 [Chloroflexi bacterium]|nr:hypothetical protein [Chloroflexota bacterium]